MEVRSFTGLSITHLKDPRTIQQVKQEGESAVNSLAILVTRTNDFQTIRYAVIASRSVGGAVQRNRCRRRLRARAVENLKRLEVGMDCLLIARKKLLYAEPREVDAAVLDLFNRICKRMSKNE
ncbi:MAG TPA: ribonuclease P protein component [Anaerolineaceae bacterium]|nr:ribonuclease P protein component [Anaerolineaceae bacterium]